MEFIYRGHILRIFVGMMALLLLLTGSANALSNSGGGSWHYYRNISINNTGGILTDYQVLVDLNGSTFPIESNGSGTDVRFTDTNGAELSYWIKEWDYVNRTGRIWVNVTRIDEHGNTGLRMWYGNPRARSSSNGTSTFEFYDDFDDNSFDTVRWSEECLKQSGGEYVPIPCVDHVIERNQVLEINLESDAGYNANTDVWSNNNYPEGTAIEYDYKNADSYSYLYKHQLLHSDTDDNTGWGWGDWGPLDFGGIENGNTSVIHIKDYVSNDNFWFNGQLIYNSNRTVRGIMTRYDGVIYGDVLNSSFPIKPPRRLLLQTTLWYGGTPKRIYYDNIRMRKYAEPEPSISIGNEIVLTHSVCPSGCDFARIQDAIDNASEGDTILVYSGTYYENVNVNKKLILRSEINGETLVDAGGGSSAITLSAGWSTVEGFTVVNSTLNWFPDGGGIHVNSDNNLIRNNTAYNNNYGIFLIGSNNNILSSNNASFNYVGIYMYGSGNNILTNNIISENKENFDLYGFSNSDYDNKIDTSNLVDGKPIYYLKNEVNTSYGNSINAGTFYCINCINITIENIALENNHEGIFFWNTTYSRIQNVNVSNNTVGIRLDHSGNNELINNNALKNKYGILLRYSSNNILAENNVSNNEHSGIYLVEFNNNNTLSNNVGILNKWHGIILLFSSNNNTLTGNNVSKNIYGIRLTRSCNNNRIDQNYASDNSYGIYVDDSSNNLLRNNNDSNGGIFLVSSNNNNLSGNTALNSFYGIYVGFSSYKNDLGFNNVLNNGYGIYLMDSRNNTLNGNNVLKNNYGIYLYSSSNNTIYNNYFNNTKNAHDDGNNIWNISRTSGTNIINGSWLGGNFWNDYAGHDIDGDGMGDTLLPYNSTAEIMNNGDMHPLIFTAVSEPPVANCGPDKLRCENVNSPVLFDGSASYDTDGTIVSYEWEFGDGTTGAGAAPEHVYSNYRWNGSAYQPYIVNLTVTDNSGLTNRTSQNVTIWMAGDANGDGKMNILDASLVGLRWGGNDPCADLNNDGKVNILDASIIGLNWGRTV